MLRPAPPSSNRSFASRSTFSMVFLRFTARYRETAFVCTSATCINPSSPKPPLRRNRLSALPLKSPTFMIYLRNSKRGAWSSRKHLPSRPGVELIFRYEIPMAMSFPSSHTGEIERFRPRHPPPFSQRKFKLRHYRPADEVEHPHRRLVRFHGCA